LTAPVTGGLLLDRPLSFDRFNQLSRRRRYRVSGLRFRSSAAEGFLERGWVIANHKLVSFHAAFISSVLNLPDGVRGRTDALLFMFLSRETALSLAILYLSWHLGIAVHEMGHYVTAARLSALNPDSQREADGMEGKGLLSRLGWYFAMLVRIPWGRFPGVRKDGGNYAPDAPYNLAVSAAGPVWSGMMAMIALPVAAVCIGTGLAVNSHILVYTGRFFLAPGLVGLLDRMLADRGKLREFRQREKRAALKQAEVESRAGTAGWLSKAAVVRSRLLTSRIRSVELPVGGSARAPWQFRNCAMGGRHTEKEYPESNVSMQESMFVPLSTVSYEESQEMTVALQYRLKEIIESAPGAKVMGIGLEGGLAPYVEKDSSDRVPEQRLWRMMRQAILDCGFEPGVDVAIALDPAASEMENAYRKETGRTDSVGMYRFWRDRSRTDMSRDELLALYVAAMEEDDIPIISVEDGFGELDHDGWRLMMEGDPASGVRGLGDTLLVVGDDLVTTKDETIECCSMNGEINAVLIKANQIGTLSETVLAMLTALAYGSELIVSHRSKSPNDPFEADIAVAMNALGLKAGGGTNTERLQKYARVSEILALAGLSRGVLSPDLEAARLERVERLLAEFTGRDDVEIDPSCGGIDVVALLMRMLAITVIDGNEEATNAGIPSVAATVILGSTGTIRFKGSTPLGTSAGEDEAIHLVDSIIPPGEVPGVHMDLFTVAGDGTLRFAPHVNSAVVRDRDDEGLQSLWETASRYGGKGCKRAVGHIESVLAELFTGRELGSIGSVLEIDRDLLALELRRAEELGRIDPGAPGSDRIRIMQRKGVLGMNAILSVSLALARALAARDGLELWQLIRAMAVRAMTGFIAANDPGYAGRESELGSLDFDEMTALFRSAAVPFRGSEPGIHRMLREYIPVYGSE
jgi:enolase